MARPPGREGLHLPLRLGVIGASPGNGHPYSWSAILNGYDHELMEKCPFPAIPQYLAERKLGNGVIDGVNVTHIWCQEEADAELIADACRIRNVASSIEDLIDHVDAVLVARDDPESHPPLAAALINAKTPGFIDKPFAIAAATAREMFSWDPASAFLFTCSGLRYSRELTPLFDAPPPGPYRLDGFGPKGWDLYSVHVIEPVLRLLPPGAEVEESFVSQAGKCRRLEVSWSTGHQSLFQTSGVEGTPFVFEIDGRRVEVADVFSAFRSSLEAFVEFLLNPLAVIPRIETLRVIELIERGRG